MPRRTDEIDDEPPLPDERGFYEESDEGWSDDDGGEWCQDVFVSN